MRVILFASIYLGVTYEKVYKNKNRPKCAYSSGGGVLVISAILSFSLLFASCSNPSDTDSDNDNSTNITDNNSNSNNNNSNNNSNDTTNNDNNNNNDNTTNNNNPSPSLPENEGENPIEETVKLYSDKGSDEDSRYCLELKTDGTALYIQERTEGDELEAEFKYTYDENKKEIYMKVEKCYYEYPMTHEERQLLTYNEMCSKLDEDATVEKARQFLKEYYKEECEGKDWFKEEYPNCNSYEDYEAEVMNSGGFDSFDDYVKYVKQNYENIYKVQFGAKIVYAYESKGGKMTLTEKFTGVKNLSIMGSGCHYFNSQSSYGGIYNYAAYIMENDIYYYGLSDTDNKIINFPSENIKATYTEDIATETVTIRFNGKDYECKFQGKNFSQ